MKYQVHIRQQWSERFCVEVEADSLEQAKQEALEDAEDKEFSWENTEFDEREIMFVENEEGTEVYCVDDG